MAYQLNETHNPDASSWVPSAKAPTTDFPIQNLPFGVYTTPAHPDAGRVGVAIGDHILDVARCDDRGLFAGSAAVGAEACRSGSLNALLALGRPVWSALRARLSELIRANHPDRRHHQRLVEPALVPMASATMLRPMHVPNYTDFYASIHHATNVGAMLRPENPLFPNYKYLPVGYHGRASSVVVSGTPIVRPHGQVQRGEAPPEYRASERLDFELEVGFVVGPGNALGSPVPIERAEDSLFGMCLLNDWSARDIQQWEYQPLGPFLGKSFATTVSPWIVTMEALEPFRQPPAPRPHGDPAPLAYLDAPANRARGAIELDLEVSLSTARMREEGAAPVRISASNLRHLYWTPAQLVVHHTSNGCNLQPGDLLGSGTVSGPESTSRGCLLELTWRGRDPILLAGGEERRCLEDGDEVVFSGRAVREGIVGIGLGECRGRILGG